MVPMWIICVYGDIHRHKPCEYSTCDVFDQAGQNIGNDSNANTYQFKHNLLVAIRLKFDSYLQQRENKNY